MDLVNKVPSISPEDFENMLNSNINVRGFSSAKHLLLIVLKKKKKNLRILSILFMQLSLF